MKGRKAYGTCENPTPARICVCMCVTVKYHNMRFNVKQIGVPIHGESDVLWITLRLYKSKLSSLIGKDFYNLFSPHFRVLPFPSASFLYYFTLFSYIFAVSRVGKVSNRTSEREYPHLASYFREKVLSLSLLQCYLQFLKWVSFVRLRKFLLFPICWCFLS